MRAPIPAPSLDRALARLLEQLEPGDLACEVERVLRMGAFGTKGRRTTVEDACRRLGLDHKRLAEQLKWRELPNMQTLLAWGRLLGALIVWRPKMGGHSVSASLDHVAAKLGWHSGNLISQSLLRHAEIYPKGWLEAGGDLDELCDLFVQRWRAKSGVTA